MLRRRLRRSADAPQSRLDAGRQRRAGQGLDESAPQLRGNPHARRAFLELVSSKPVPAYLGPVLGAVGRQCSGGDVYRVLSALNRLGRCKDVLAVIEHAPDRDEGDGGALNVDSHLDLHLALCAKTEHERELVEGWLDDWSGGLKAVGETLLEYWKGNRLGAIRIQAEFARDSLSVGARRPMRAYLKNLPIQASESVD